MSKENVVKFYDEAKKNDKLKAEFENLQNEMQKTEQVKDFDSLAEKIVYIGKKYNFDFSKEELNSYLEDLKSNLTDEDLLNISGGRLSPKVAAIGMLGVLGISCIAGTAVKMSQFPSSTATQQEAVLSNENKADNGDKEVENEDKYDGKNKDNNALNPSISNNVSNPRSVSDRTQRPSHAPDANLLKTLFGNKRNDKVQNESPSLSVASQQKSTSAGTSSQEESLQDTIADMEEQVLQGAGEQDSTKQPMSLDSKTEAEETNKVMTAGSGYYGDQIARKRKEEKASQGIFDKDNKTLDAVQSMFLDSETEAEETNKVMTAGSGYYGDQIARKRKEEKASQGIFDKDNKTLDAVQSMFLDSETEAQAKVEALHDTIVDKEEPASQGTEDQGSTVQPMSLDSETEAEETNKVMTAGSGYYGDQIARKRKEEKASQGIFDKDNKTLDAVQSMFLDSETEAEETNKVMTAGSGYYGDQIARKRKEEKASQGIFDKDNKTLDAVQSMFLDSETEAEAQKSADAANLSTKEVKEADADAQGEADAAAPSQGEDPQDTTADMDEPASQGAGEQDSTEQPMSTDTIVDKEEPASQGTEDQGSTVQPMSLDSKTETEETNKVMTAGSGYYEDQIARKRKEEPASQGAEKQDSTEQPTSLDSETEAEETNKVMTAGSGYYGDQIARKRKEEKASQGIFDKDNKTLDAVQSMFLDSETEAEAQKSADAANLSTKEVKEADADAQGEADAAAPSQGEDPQDTTADMDEPASQGAGEQDSTEQPMSTDTIVDKEEPASQGTEDQGSTVQPMSLDSKTETEETNKVMTAGSGYYEDQIARKRKEEPASQGAEKQDSTEQPMSPDTDATDAQAKSDADAQKAAAAANLSTKEVKEADADAQDEAAANAQAKSDADAVNLTAEVETKDASPSLTVASQQKNPSDDAASLTATVDKEEPASQGAVEKGSTEQPTSLDSETEAEAQKADADAQTESDADAQDEADADAQDEADADAQDEADADAQGEADADAQGEADAAAPSQGEDPQDTTADMDEPASQGAGEQDSTEQSMSTDTIVYKKEPALQGTEDQDSTVQPMSLDSETEAEETNKVMTAGSGYYGDQIARKRKEEKASQGIFDKDSKTLDTVQSMFLDAENIAKIENVKNKGHGGVYIKLKNGEDSFTISRGSLQYLATMTSMNVNDIKYIWVNEGQVAPKLDYEMSEIFSEPYNIPWRWYGSYHQNSVKRLSENEIKNKKIKALVDLQVEEEVAKFIVEHNINVRDLDGALNNDKLEVAKTMYREGVDEITAKLMNDGKIGKEVAKFILDNHIDVRNPDGALNNDKLAIAEIMHNQSVNKDIAKLMHDGLNKNIAIIMVGRKVDENTATEINKIADATSSHIGQWVYATLKDGETSLKINQNTLKYLAEKVGFKEADDVKAIQINKGNVIPEISDDLKDKFVIKDVDGTVYGKYENVATRLSENEIKNKKIKALVDLQVEEKVAKFIVEHNINVRDLDGALNNDKLEVAKTMYREGVDEITAKLMNDGKIGKEVAKFILDNHIDVRNPDGALNRNELEIAKIMYREGVDKETAKLMYDGNIDKEVAIIMVDREVDKDTAKEINKIAKVTSSHTGQWVYATLKDGETSLKINQNTLKYLAEKAGFKEADDVKAIQINTGNVIPEISYDLKDKFVIEDVDGTVYGKYKNIAKRLSENEIKNKKIKALVDLQVEEKVAKFIVEHNINVRNFNGTLNDDEIAVAKIMCYEGVDKDIADLMHDCEIGKEVAKFILDKHINVRNPKGYLIKDEIAIAKIMYREGVDKETAKLMYDGNIDKEVAIIMVDREVDKDTAKEINKIAKVTSSHTGQWVYATLKDGETSLKINQNTLKYLAEKAGFKEADDVKAIQINTGNVIPEISYDLKDKFVIEDVDGTVYGKYKNIAKRLSENEIKNKKIKALVDLQVEEKVAKFIVEHNINVRNFNGTLNDDEIAVAKIMCYEGVDKDIADLMHDCEIGKEVAKFILDNHINVRNPNGYLINDEIAIAEIMHDEDVDKETAELMHDGLNKNVAIIMVGRTVNEETATEINKIAKITSSHTGQWVYATLKDGETSLKINQNTLKYLAERAGFKEADDVKTIQINNGNVIPEISDDLKDKFVIEDVDGTVYGKYQNVATRLEENEIRNDNLDKCGIKKLRFDKSNNVVYITMKKDTTTLSISQEVSTLKESLLNYIKELTKMDIKTIYVGMNESDFKKGGNDEIEIDISGTKYKGKKDFSIGNDLVNEQAPKIVEVINNQGDVTVILNKRMDRFKVNQEMISYLQKEAGMVGWFSTAPLKNLTVRYGNIKVNIELEPSVKDKYNLLKKAKTLQAKN